MRHHRAALPSLAAALLLVACRGGETRSNQSDSTRYAEFGDQPSDAKLVGIIADQHGPESARYDPDQDVWFVSNMLGYGSDHDGNGYIVKVNADDPSDYTVFIQGDSNGVTLDAPKGLAIHGDTLWTADIDVVRGFSRTTGAPLATIDLRPQHAVLLNDLTIGEDGAIYVTDTGIGMTEKGVIYGGGQKIFRIGAGGAITVVAQGPALGYPNGITWDSAKHRLVVVTFGQFSSEIYAITPGDSTRTPLAHGKGRFDGVEILPDGRLVFTCWNDSSIHVLQGTTDERIIRAVPMPADIGYDTKRHRLAIPVDGRDRVELYQLPDDIGKRVASK